MSTQEQTSGLNSQTFNSDHLTVTVNKLPHCLIKFDIFVQPQALTASYAQALKNVRKEVNIPGFRKGKAPDQLILERFAAPIQKEWVDVSLQTAFNEALQLSNLHPLKDGIIKRPVVHECSKEKGARFTIEFETRPTIPTVNFEDLQLKKFVAKEITQKDRNQALKQVINQFITYESITDRPVQAGDFIDIDVDALENEQTRRVINNQRTQVIEEDLPTWLRDKVIGLRQGETAEGESEPDETTTQETAHFNPMPFRVTINAIWTGKIPPIDDELANKMNLSSAEELKQKVDERLEREAHEAVSQQETHQLEAFLLEKYQFDLPQSLIERNAQGRFKDYLNQLSQEQPHASFDYRAIENQIRESTARHLQLLFLLHKVANDHQVTITQEDVTQELGRQLALVPSGRSQINLSNNKEDLRDQVQSLAFDHKIKQFLLDKATFIEG